MKHKYFIVYLFLIQACRSLTTSQMMPASMWTHLSRHQRELNQIRNERGNEIRDQIRNQIRDEIRSFKNNKIIQNLGVLFKLSNYYPVKNLNLKYLAANAMFRAYADQIKLSKNPNQAQKNLFNCIIKGCRPYTDSNTNEIEVIPITNSIRNYLLSPMLQHMILEVKDEYVLEEYLQLRAALNLFTKEYAHHLDDIQVLEKLILFNMDEIKYENNTDYRYKPDGQSIPGCPHYNKFFNYHTWFSNKSASERCYHDAKEELETPLAIAIYSKSPNVLNGYLDHLIKAEKRIPIDMNTTDLLNTSSLKYAIRCCNPEMVYSLIKYAPKVAEAGAIDLNQALREASLSGRLNILKLLIAEGADPNEPNIAYLNQPDGYNSGNLLIDSIRDGCLNAAIYLVDLIKDLNTTESYGHTALTLTVARYPGSEDYLLRKELVKALLKKGADITKVVSNKNILMFEIMRNSSYEIIDLLCDHPDIKEIIDQQDETGKTALMLAARADYIWMNGTRERNIVERLIDAGADKDNIRDQEGKTAMDYICYSRYEEIRELYDKFVSN